MENFVAKKISRAELMVISSIGNLAASIRKLQLFFLTFFHPWRCCPHYSS